MLDDESEVGIANLGGDRRSSARLGYGTFSNYSPHSDLSQPLQLTCFSPLNLQPLP